MKSYAPKPRREDVPVPLRDAGLAFLDAAKRGMTEAELSSWCRKQLLARGYLRLRDPMRGRFAIVEPGAGSLEMTTLEAVDEGSRDREAAKLTQVAHRRVVDVLSLLLESPPDDRFLNAAIQSSRVARTRAPKEKTARWTPSLTEGDSLSYMVVTLFAADALEARDDYDTHLRICRTCNELAFDGAVVGRHACPAHASVIPHSSGVIKRGAEVAPETKRGTEVAPETKRERFPRKTLDSSPETRRAVDAEVPRENVRSSGVRRHPATSPTEPALQIDTKKAPPER